MAYLRKLSSGKWRAEVEKHGVRDSQGGFGTKAEATEWATKREAEIIAGKRGDWPAKTLSEALDRYELEVSSKKETSNFEARRFAALKRDYPELVGKLLVEVTTDDLNRWQLSRLERVKEATVRREVNTLSNVWTVAGTVWKWCPKESPWSFLEKPSDGPPRDRRVTWREARVLLRRMGYVTGMVPASKQGELAYAWLIALSTCMRVGEILGLTAESVDLSTRVAKIDKHKTRRYTGRPRFVPLPPRSIKFFRVLISRAGGAGPLFTLTTGSQDALFRKLAKQCLIHDMHFHDSRGEAMTLLSRRVDPLTLAKISGHSDLQQIIDVYYRETPAQIAARLPTSGRPQGSSASNVVKR